MHPSAFRNVLILDNDSITLQIHEMLLSEQLPDVKIYTADNVESAVEIVNNNFKVPG